MRKNKDKEAVNSIVERLGVCDRRTSRQTMKRDYSEVFIEKHYEVQ